MKKYDLTDEQALAIRNALHCICENVIDNYIKECIKKSQPKK